MNQLVYNAIRCPDGTILVSRFRHDYVTHVDGITGEQYMLDGGLDYVRTNVNEVEAESLAVYLEDGHDKVREVLEWGSYGKDGDQPLRYIPLKDMETDHIEAVLECCNIPLWREIVMKEELKLREHRSTEED